MASRIATAHLLHGFIGAGKTTFARDLERRYAAVRFTPDAWMAALFGADPPADDFSRHDRAIKAQLRTLWTRLLGLGIDVVLDYGFWTRAERDQTRAVVLDVGATPRLYSLSVGEDIARKRIARRNTNTPAELHISWSTYTLLRRGFQPLQSDEAAESA